MDVGNYWTTTGNAMPTAQEKGKAAAVAFCGAVSGSLVVISFAAWWHRGTCSERGDQVPGLSSSL